MGISYLQCCLVNYSMSKSRWLFIVYPTFRPARHYEFFLFHGISKSIDCSIFAGLFRDVVQPGRIHAWGACGRWFESSHPDEENPTQMRWIFCLRRAQTCLQARSKQKGQHSRTAVLDFLQFPPLWIT